MYRFALLLLTCFSIVACGSSKSIKTNYTNAREKNHSPAVDKKLYDVVNHALSYEGTRYKFGGTTKRGMDCSGLVYVAFQEENIALPRVSRDMAREGKSVKTKEVQVGDLLFFKTNGSGRINHVGLVVDIIPGQILFVHSTSSRGVIVSSLNEGYWNNAYTEARRII